MPETYERINKDLHKLRRDVSFDTSLLNSLSDEERKNVEEKIVKLCLSGDKSCFKYIDHLKFYDPKEVFTDDNMIRLEPSKKSLILRKMYELTENDEYLNKMIDIASQDMETYTSLLIMYDDKILDAKRQDYLGRKLKEFAQGDDEHKKMFKSILGENFMVDNKVDLKMVEAGVLGFATADALGVPVEFSARQSRKINPTTEMLGYGSHNVPEGTWSDDTSMTIAAMDAIASSYGNMNYDQIMTNFCKWYQRAEYTATNKLFDIGIGTRKALNKYLNEGLEATKCGESEERNNGNGSLMRMLPVVYYLYDKSASEKEIVETINYYSSLTHGHEISRLGCKIYYDFMKNLLDGKTKEEAYTSLSNIDYSKDYSESSISKYNRLLSGKLKQTSENEISSSGYVVNTLEASIWCLLHSNSYEEAVTKAVNLGEDTDTVGAVTGSMAGTIYGKEAIPKRWISKLKRTDYLENICEKFTTALSTEYRVPFRFEDIDSINSYENQKKKQDLTEMLNDNSNIVELKIGNSEYKK